MSVYPYWIHNHHLFDLTMKTPKITPEEIGMVKRAQAGDMLAFNHIFYRYKGFVEHVLYSYIKDMDEAQDIANIVFLKVYEKLSTFTTYDSFGGWLRMITNHTAIDYLRERAAKNSSVDIDTDNLSVAYNVSTDDDIVNRLTYEQILATFRKFPKHVQQICEMFYVDNVTVSDISKTLNIPTGTIKSILSRTRQRIKKQFKTI